MILLNFAHPIPSAQRTQIEALIGQPLNEERHHPAQFDHGRSFPEQVRELAQAVGLTPEQWQSEAILVNPPTLSILAVILLAELHGRMGYFPAVLRLKPVEGPLTQFEVAEIVNLEQVRSQARKAR